MKPVLAALGIVNALGSGQQQVLAALLSSNAPGMQPVAGWIQGQDITVGVVQGDLPVVPGSLAEFNCRNNRLLAAALAEIRSAVETAIDRFGPQRIGVVLGSSTSGIAEGEAAIAYRLHSGHWPDGYHYRQQEIGTPALFLARVLGLEGPAMTVSTACSSSSKTFGSARALLELGLCDAVICGGADSLCHLTLHGFGALESIASQHCDPFAIGRDGITIGEGAALFLMENRPAQPGEVVLAGVGESADAYHMSAPHPDGAGAEAAMRSALQDAGLSPADISYINLHGTATPLNDAMESAAVARVFGTGVPCSSTKPLTGHTLGAAGAMEAALCWLLMSPLNRAHTLPPQRNITQPDPSLPAIALLRTRRQLPDTGIARMLSNSFAFGGSNAAVILECCE